MGDSCLTDYDLQARWDNGNLVAVLDNEYCPVQTWMIRDVGEFALD